jgi:hypothetical protein
MLTLAEDGDVILIESRMRTGQRVVLLMAAFFPLLAPYELIIRPTWQDNWNVFFVFAAAISAGATIVAVLLAYSAVAGLNNRMVFDRGQGTFSYASGAPLVQWRTSQCPIVSIAELKKTTSEWTEGAPSFSFAVRTTDGRSFRSGSSRSEREVDSIIDRVSLFLDHSART